MSRSNNAKSWSLKIGRRLTTLIPNLTRVMRRLKTYSSQTRLWPTRLVCKTLRWLSFRKESRSWSRRGRLERATSNALVNSVVKTFLTTRILIGRAEPTDLSGQAKCGGAAVKQAATPSAVNSKSTLRSRKRTTTSSASQKWTKSTRSACAAKRQGI